MVSSETTGASVFRHLLVTHCTDLWSHFTKTTWLRAVYGSRNALINKINYTKTNKVICKQTNKGTQEQRSPTPRDQETPRIFICVGKLLKKEVPHIFSVRKAKKRRNYTVRSEWQDEHSFILRFSWRIRMGNAEESREGL